MDSLTPRVLLWKERGHVEKFRTHNIHCYHQPGNGSGPLLVILHGYPTNSYDWIKVIDALPSKSILTFDLLGFGLSDKPPEHNYTLHWQADLAEELILRHNNSESNSNRPVILIGHDMSTSLVSELIARELDGTLRPKISLQGAFLFNGSMFMERANLILGQKLLRNRFLGSWAARLTFSLAFKWQLGRVFSSGHPLTTEEGEDQWALMSWMGGHRINDKLISYTFERVEKAERWLGAVRDWEKPVAYCWGMEDPVCGQWQLDGWKELRPNAPLIEMKGLGHYPQIEDPQKFTQVMKQSLDFVMNHPSLK